MKCEIKVLLLFIQYTDMLLSLSFALCIVNSKLNSKKKLLYTTNATHN